jgi:Na+-translocating ferredoxin:NAD+ oxidoreductase RnfG subunit
LKGRVALLLGVLAAAPVLAHVTPPVVLASDRDVVSGMLAGAKRFFVHEVRLTAAERQRMQKETGWRPEEDFYRFYIGRDEQLHDVGAVTFLTEYTIHGPVRIAVGLAPDGKVSGVQVVELSEETYPWVKGLIDRGFLRTFNGRDAHASFAAGAAGGSSMPQFYGNVIAGLVRRAALLYAAGIVGRERP